MAEDTDTPAEAPKKKKGGAMPLIIGLVAALVLGGATAFAVMSGIVPIPGDEQPADGGQAEGGHGEEKMMDEAHAPKFVGFDPLTVTFQQDGAARQLRIALSIETTEPYLQTVEEQKPRILDALNTLLRALDERDISDPSALDRLRAQMLRRIRISTDPTAIQDLLITEYVIF